MSIESENEANEPSEQSVVLTSPCKIGIAWKERLEPLGDPARYGYSNRDFSGNTSGAWKTWAVETHIERLYQRCDSLLRRCEEQEELIAKLLQR